MTEWLLQALSEKRPEHIRGTERGHRLRVKGEAGSAEWAAKRSLRFFVFFCRVSPRFDVMISGHTVPIH